MTIRLTLRTWALAWAPADVCQAMGWLWALQVGPVNVVSKKRIAIDRDCCLACETKWMESTGASPFARHFIFCSTCGNKRCPRATNHELTCSGSNDVGQPGSAWEHVSPPQSTPTPEAAK